MKKLLLIAISAICTMYSFAQNRAVLLQESFDGTSMPAGWSINGQNNNWSVSPTNNAGGQPNEMHLTWSPQFNGMTRLVSPAVNLTGVSSVVFSFKHALDNYSGSNTIGIATSSDGGSTWNQGWSQGYSASNTYSVSQQITTPDMGQANVQFCIFFNGSSYNINDWFFDDIMVFTLENLDLNLTNATMNDFIGSGEAQFGIGVFNMGTTAVTSVEATYQVEGMEPVTEQFTVNIPSLSTSTLNFTTPTTLAPGTYNVDYTINLVNGQDDDNADNNVLAKAVSVALGTAHRYPMIEHFSSSTCGPCVQPNTMMHTFCNNNEGRYTYTKYQMNWPGNGDPYYTEEAGVRRNYYSVNAVPMAFLDGAGLNFNGVQNQFDQHAEWPAFFDIAGSFAVEGNTISVKADIMPYVEANARVFISVNEKETHNNVGSNGETSFHHIFMKMLTSTEGENTDFVTGEIQHFEYTQDLSLTNVEEMSDLEVAVWVQNYDSKEIYNSRFAYEYTYHPYPIENLIITRVHKSESNTLTASWNAPSSSNPMGYDVYVNSELVAENTTDRTYTFQGEVGVFYTVAVVALYGQGKKSIKVITGIENGGSTTNYTITATANPTNGGTVSGGGTYAQGSTCTLHATPNSGYSFVKWTRNGTQVSTNPNYSFTVTGNAAYVAHFQQSTTNYTITATASPSNAGTITGAGSYASGSTCTLRATPNSGYRFVNWLENGTSVSTNATYSFTVTGNRNLVAVFDVATTNYTITATANPSNGGSVTGGGTYASGSTCTLRATANSGYTFVNWTKNGTQVSTNPDYSFTVTGNASYVANFEPIPEEYTITVNAEPANGGTVSGGGTYAEGSTCVISAMPNEDYVFDNWTRNGTVVSTEPTYNIVVNRNLTFVAHFAQNANQATITATAEPVEGGSVSGGGTYELGSNCTLNAVAAVGYEFVNWTLNGSQVSTDASFSFTVTGNAVYVAHFSKIVNHYTVSANVQPANAGSVIGAGTYEEGTSCTLIAMANPTYTFVSWTENGAVVSTDEQYTFTVERDRNLVAVFSQGLFYTITASAGGNGSITPEGEIMVNPGEDKTFAIIPNSGCRVSKVLVDGVDVGPVESYTFRSVNANHSIRAQFSGLGVDDNPMHELKIYPNPANDVLNIEGNDIKRIAVFDLLGVQLADKEINDDQAILPTSNFAQGTYILKVEFEDGSVGYSRFVVAR